MEAMLDLDPQDPDIDQRVRDNVRILLGVNQMRDSDLARRLHVHRATVSGKLTGASRFTMSEAWKIARILDVPLDVLAMEPGELQAQVRAAVGGSRTGSRQALVVGGAMPAAPRGARHLTPVGPRNGGFCDTADSGPLTLDLPPTLKLVR